MLQGSSWRTLQLLSPLLEVSALICSSLLRERMQILPLQSHTKLAIVLGGQHFQSQLFPSRISLDFPFTFLFVAHVPG